MLLLAALISPTKGMVILPSRLIKCVSVKLAAAPGKLIFKVSPSRSLKASGLLVAALLVEAPIAAAEIWAGDICFCVWQPVTTTNASAINASFAANQRAGAGSLPIG